MGLAVLKDGRTMDYDEYLKTPEWQNVREQRIRADNYQCVACHKPVASETAQIHHLNYDRLGHEILRDVVTMCGGCHSVFHARWRRQEFWKGREVDHWENFDLGHTAKMCLMFYKDDLLICKDATAPNVCNQDVCRQYVDQYTKMIGKPTGVLIDPNDLQLFVRNKRIEMWLSAMDRGLSMEEFLNECYGEKVRGKNPIRVIAGQYFTKEPAKYRKIYKENKNINTLMEEVRKGEINYAETE